jgi:hypothetical protein
MVEVIPAARLLSGNAQKFFDIERSGADGMETIFVARGYAPRKRDQINGAQDRMLKSDVKYRFVMILHNKLMEIEA